MDWIWYFVIYSVCGFCLEVVFARVTGTPGARKGALLLPICPVYGLGAMVILMPSGALEDYVLALFLVGGVAATAVEYAVAAWYEQGLGVSFWDYTGLPGNVQGRVCLPFSVAWGVLAVVLVRFVHPVVRGWVSAIPLPVTVSVAVLVATDLVVSSVMMKRTGNRECLCWYRKAA